MPRVSTVLIIGAGDLGERFAAGLAAAGVARRLVLVSRTGAAEAAAMVASAHDVLVEPVACDASRPDDVADLLARVAPDLVIQSAAGRGPWALAGRDDEAARAVAAAGFALRLPYQLPVPLAVMRAVRDTGYPGPVANVSLPDVTGPVLARLGLAPTVGLGNVGMILLRARAALRSASPDAELPLVRVLAHHAQLSAVMQAREPADRADRPRIWVGEPGQPEDGLAYAAPALAPSLRYNYVTAAALPVLRALLPGAAPLRWSTPSPAGRPGGYPVLIDGGTVSLDLPPGITPEEAIAFNERLAYGDGVERIDDDGTVHFTAACREAVATLDPGLADPLPVSDLDARAARLDAALA
jgi:KR domain